MREIDEKLIDKKYFIFDIDGTLVDTMQMWNMIDQAAVMNIAGVFVELDDVKTIRDSVVYSENNIGGNIYELFYAEMINRFNLGITVDEYKKLRHDYAEHLAKNEIDFKSGAGEFLKILKALEKKIGVATTTTHAQLDIYSNQNQKMKSNVSIKAVADAIVTCEDVTFKKPHPEAYNKVVKLLGAKPEECIVFEDSLPGVIAAKDAGLQVVAVYDKSAESEFDEIEQIVDYRVESFDELIKILGLENIQSKMKQ